MSNNKRFLGVLAGFAVFAGSLLGMFQSSVSPDAEVHLAEDTVCVTDSYGVPVAPGEYAYFESYYSYYDSDCLPGDPVYYDADGDGVDEYDPSGDVTQDCGITDGYGSTVWPWGTASYEDYYETYDGDCTLTETYYYDTYGSSDSDGDSYSCEESSEYGLTCSECDSDSSYSYSCWDDSSSSSEYYCENSTEGSKECSTCYENDKETSSSCWINDYDSSGSYSSDGKTCEYYQDGNLFCSSCDDAKGNFENSNCWENSGDWTTEYYTEVRAGEERQCMKSYEDGVLENLSCWELTDATYDYEQPETDNDWEERYYSNATCVENNNGSSNGSWCEVCVDKSGDLVNTGSYNSCSDDVINDTLKDLGFDVEEEDDDDGDRDEDEDDEDYFCETASFFDEQSCVDAGCCEDKDYDDYEDDDFFDDNADYLTEEEWEELEDKRREDHEQWEEDRERYEEDLLEKSGDWIVEDVRMMRDEITDFEDGFSALKPYITDSLALRKINEVLDVVDSALDLLDDIEDKAGDFDDHNEIDEQFRKLDDLGRYVDPRIMFVIDHVKPNYDSFGFSSDDDEKISSVILEFDMHDDDFRDDECRHCDRFEEVSWNEDAQDLVQNLLDDKLDGLVNSLVQEISSASIDKLAELIDDAVRREVERAFEDFTERFMANIGHFDNSHFGDGFADEMLVNNNLVFEEIASVPESIEDYSTLADTLDMIAEEPMPDADFAEDVADYVVEVSAFVETNPTPAAVAAKVEDGEALLAELEELKIDNKLSFRDVPGPLDSDFEDVWYAEDVMSGFAADRWSGQGVTGNFAPAETNNVAEATKMVLAAHEHESRSTSGEWYDGWVDEARFENMSIANLDPTAPVTRGQIAQAIYELGDYEAPVTCEGIFTDIDANHENCTALGAMWENGVFEGNPDGSVSPDGVLNRAEAAKIIEAAAAIHEDSQFAEDLVSYYDGSYGFFANFADFASDVFSGAAKFFLK